MANKILKMKILCSMLLFVAGIVVYKTQSESTESTNIIKSSKNYKFNKGSRAAEQKKARLHKRNPSSIVKINHGFKEVLTDAQYTTDYSGDVSVANKGGTRIEKASTTSFSQTTPQTTRRPSSSFSQADTTVTNPESSSSSQLQNNSEEIIAGNPTYKDASKESTENETSSSSSKKTDDVKVSSPPLVKGKIPPLVGIIVVDSGFNIVENAYSAASTCTNPKITLFDINTMTVLADNPITAESLSTTTNFQFEPVGLSLDITKPTKYLLKTSGCDINYERIVTSYFTEQDLTPTSTLVSKIIKSAASINLENLDGSKIESFINTIDSQINTNDEIEASYSVVDTNPGTQAKFEEAFEGENYQVLADSAPDIAELTIPSTLQEKVASIISVQTQHWNTAYTTGYEWHIDGLKESNLASWSYTPSANSKRNIEVKLYIGKAVGAAGSDVDRTLPYHELTYSIDISDDAPTTAPNIALNSGSTNPTQLRNILIDVSTGADLGGYFQNCESFSNFAITEGSTIPLPADFSYTCTTPITQVINPYSLTSSDGDIEVNIWAKDINGDISAKKNFTVNLDTSAPAITIDSLAAAYRADTTLTLDWTVLEANQNSANQHIVEFFDGSSWNTLTPVASANGFLNNQAFSTSYLLPNILVSNARLRVSLTDVIGNTGVSETADFEIQRPTLAISPTSYDFGSVLNNSLGTNHTFTISNSGTADTKDCSVASLAAANASEFEITTDNCGSGDIGPSESCDIIIRPKPTTKGSKVATINWTCGLDSVVSNLSYNSSNNIPTVPSDYALSVNEDNTLNFSATVGNDIDSDPLTYTITSSPSNGILSNCMATDADLTCDYTPNLNYNGADSFSYKVNDGTADSLSSATVSITVVPVNDAPTVATTQSVSTNEDTPITFDLNLGSDIEGSSLDYIKLTDTSNGVISCTGGTSRSCTYTPSLNYNGSDSFTFKVNDGDLDSSTATVSITVNAINDAPTLVDPQAVATNEDTPITFDLGIGSDTEGDTLSYIKVTDTTNGTITCTGGTSRSCTYTPNLNFNGADSFTYKVNDSALDSNTATVNITVNAVNDAPTLASTQTINVTEDTTLNFSLNSGADVDVDTLTYIITQNPAAGTLTCTGGTSTSCTYTPVADDINTYTFKYKVNDGNLDSPEATVTVNINNTNDAPVMIGDQTVTTNEDTLVSFTLNGATDIDPAQTLGYKVITAPSNGTLSNCIGAAGFTTDITCDYTPNANFNGTDSFTYRANDGVADSATVSTVTINITPVNDAPTLVTPQSYATNEDTPLTFNVAAGADIESDTLSYIKLSNPSSGTLTCVGGTSRSCTFTPVANYNGAVSFTYKVNDGALDSNTATVNITVNAINDAPTLVTPQSFATNEDTVLNFNLGLGSDIEGDTLSYIKLTNPASGTVTCTGGTSRACTYTPALNYNGTVSFTYKVNDGTVDSNTATVNITVNAVNDAPTLVTPQSFATNEDTVLNFSLGLGSDIDGDTLTYVKLTNPASGTVTCTGGTSRACTYTPALNYNGTVSFTYKVNDGALDSNTSTVNITVNAVNDAPTLVTPQSFATNEDTVLNFSLGLGSDIDGDTLTYVKLTNPASGTLTCTGGTSRACTYTPALNYNGTVSFTYKVNDGALDSNTATVNITVNAVNDAPTLVTPQSFATNEDTVLNFNLGLGGDIDGDTLTYVKLTNPASGTLTCTGGTSRACTYTPALNYNGTVSFTYKVNDGALDSNTATVNITVNAVNDAPVMASNQSFSTDDNVALNFTISNATDVDGDSLSYKIISATSNGTISNCITTGTYGTDLTCTYQANTNFNGTDSFTYIANDGTTDALSTATVTFTVSDKTPSGAPPVILAHTQYRKVMGQNLTATSCSDISAIFINEGTQPTSGAAGWQTCTTTASALTYTLASATEGTHTLKAWSKDAYGNVSTLATNITVIYDITAPTLAVANPGLQRGGDAITLTWTVTEANISSSQNHTVQYWNGSSWVTITTTKSASNGPLSGTTFTQSWTTPSLNRTDIKIRVSLTDLAGNNRTSDSTTFEIDSTAPVLTFTSPAANSYHQSSATVTGTCETGLDINFSGNIPASFNQTCSGGSFSQLVNFDSGDGNKTITISQTDAAGNTTTTSRVLIRDEIAPVMAKTSGLSPDFTRFNQPNAWGGTCEGNYTIYVTGDENTSFSCTSGSWSWTPSAKTVDGTFTYNLVQTDGAGNTSTPPLSLSWQRDATPPTFNVNTPVAIAASATVTITNNLDSVTLTGNCEGTNTITVSGGATDAFSCSSSSWTWTTPTTTTDGTRTFNFSQADPAGNTSTLTMKHTRDTTGPALTIALNVVKNNGNTVTYSGGCETGLTVSVSGSETSSTTCPSGTWSWTSASQATDATRNYTFTQTMTVTPFNSTAVSGQWIRETNPPTISLFTTSASNPSRSAFIPIDLTATSQNSNVYLKSFCIKSDDSTTPTVSDGCWLDVNSPTVGKALAQTLSLDEFPNLLGWVPKTFDVFVWVKDEAENISVQAATIGVDKIVHGYDPGVAPEIWDVLAANVAAATLPPTRAQSSAPAGNDVYIRWKASDNNTLPSGAITLYYTPDEINFTQIVAGLDNANYGCTGYTLQANEGCYKWTGGSPLNTTYKVQVKVTDVGDISTQLVSNIINADMIKIIAGNTESGLGGSAQTALFFTRKSGSEADPGTLVATNDGRFYIADYKRGIITIDPNDGKQKVFIPGTGTSSGDGGPAVNATLRYATKIALDYQGRLLILDTDRIRRVDLNQSTPSIETIIGGGSDTADTVANPLNLSFTTLSSNSLWSRGLPFFALPNGDIYFMTEHSYVNPTHSGLRIRIYKAATGQVTSKYLTGVGDGYNAAQDLTKCRLSQPGFQFNPANSQITGVQTRVYKVNSYTDCDNNPTATDGDRHDVAYYDPSTFTAIPALDNWAAYYYYLNTTAMDGNLYRFLYRDYVQRINFDGTTTRLVGTGTRGFCVDGTPATSCNVDIQDVFITPAGKVYMLEGGQIRTIDEDGNIVTLFGQRRAYGDGVNALNARFDNINNVKRLNNGKYIVGDSSSYFIKEFTTEGNIDIIAGDGNLKSYPSTATLATAQGFYDGSWYSVDKATGDIFMRAYAYGEYQKLNRSSGYWENIIGIGGTETYDYWNGDGQPGLLLKSNSNQSYGLPIGFDGQNLLIARMKYNSTDSHWEDFMLKLYDSTDSYRQSHIAGTNGVDTYTGGYYGICASGSTAATCKVPYYSYYGLPYWDAPNSRWIFTRGRDSTTYGKEVYSVVQGGNVNKVAQLARRAYNGYTYLKVGATEYLYYCYDNGRIYQHNITTDTDMGALAWPVSNLYCRGLSMEYNPTNNSLVFPFEQNGLYGVGEYFLP